MVGDVEEGKGKAGSSVGGGMQTTELTGRMEWTPISPQCTPAHALRRKKSRRTQYSWLALVFILIYSTHIGS